MAHATWAQWIQNLWETMNMEPKCGEWSLQCKVSLGSISACVSSFETALFLPSVTS